MWRQGSVSTLTPAVHIFGANFVTFHVWGFIFDAAAWINIDLYKRTLETMSRVKYGVISGNRKLRFPPATVVKLLSQATLK